VVLAIIEQLFDGSEFTISKGYYYNFKSVNDMRN